MCDPFCICMNLFFLWSGPLIPTVCCRNFSYCFRFCLLFWFEDDLSFEALGDGCAIGNFFLADVTLRVESFETHKKSAMDDLLDFSISLFSSDATL